MTSVADSPDWDRSLPTRDLVVEPWCDRGSPNGGVKITHLPTGIVVANARTPASLANAAAAVRDLRALLGLDEVPRTREVTVPVAEGSLITLLLRPDGSVAWK